MLINNSKIKRQSSRTCVAKVDDDHTFEDELMKGWIQSKYGMIVNSRYLHQYTPAIPRGLPFGCGRGILVWPVHHPGDLPYTTWIIGICTLSGIPWSSFDLPLGDDEFIRNYGYCHSTGKDEATRRECCHSSSRNRAGRYPIPPQFKTLAENKGVDYRDLDIERWINEFRIPTILILSLAYVSRKVNERDVGHVMYLIRRLTLDVNDSTEVSTPSTEYVPKAGRAVAV